MIIKHYQAGNVSKTEVIFSDDNPSDSEIERVRMLLGLRRQQDQAGADDKEPEKRG